MSGTDALREKLLAKTAVGSEAECWNWTASTDTHGYGHFRFGGKIKLAHRASYEVHRGAIPAGMQVCHHCDNRACVNPAHLFLGTWRENMLDKLAKNRQSRHRFPGEKNPQSKLKEADVCEIRAAVGLTQQQLADKFDVSRPHISQIRSGGRWRDRD